MPVLDDDPFADLITKPGSTFDDDPFADLTPTATASAGDGPGALRRGFMGSLRRESPATLAETAEAVGVLSGYEGAQGIASDLRALSARAPADLARQVPSLSDIPGDGVFDTAGRALTYAGESLGAGVGSTVPSLITGTAGALAGRRAGGRLGATAGALAGAAIPSAALGYGEIYKAIKDEGVDQEKAAEYAAYALGPLVALDVGGAEGFISRLAGEARQEALRGIARRVIEEARKGVIREGLTEAAQQAVTETAASIASGNDLLTGERALRILESGVQGGIAGGALGGAAGVAPDRMAPPSIDPETNLPAGAVAADQLIGAEVDPFADLVPDAPDSQETAPGREIVNPPPPAPVTPEDIASPLPTQDIAEGKALIDELISGEPAAPVAEPVTLPEVARTQVEAPTVAARPATTEAPRQEAITEAEMVPASEPVRTAAVTPEPAPAGAVEPVIGATVETPAPIQQPRIASPVSSSDGTEYPTTASVSGIQITHPDARHAELYAFAKAMRTKGKQDEIKAWQDRLYEHWKPWIAGADLDRPASVRALARDYASMVDDEASGAAANSAGPRSIAADVVVEPDLQTQYFREAARAASAPIAQPQATPSPAQAAPAPSVETQPASEVPTATAISETAPVLYRRNDGTPYGTAKSATLSARQRADLKGRDLEPVQVDGGWALRERPPAAASREAPAVIETPSRPVGDRWTELNKQFNEIMDTSGVDGLVEYATNLRADPRYADAIAEYVNNPGPEFAGKSPEHQFISAVGRKVSNFAPQGQVAKMMRAWGSREAIWADPKTFVGKFSTKQRAEREASSGRYGPNMEAIENGDRYLGWSLRPRETVSPIPTPAPADRSPAPAQVQPPAADAPPLPGAPIAAARYAEPPSVGQATAAPGRRSRSAPKAEDLASFLARNGGIRDDEGHSLRKQRNLQRMTQHGPMIRANGGMTIDDAGEALWQDGFFGPPETTSRPTEAEVLDLLEQLQGSRRVYRPEEAQAVAASKSDAVAAEMNRAASEDVRGIAREIGERLSQTEIDEIVDIMGERGVDAETALSDYVERKAIVESDRALAQSGDDIYADDIPFEGLAGDGRQTGDGSAGRASDAGRQGGISQNSAPAAQGEGAAGGQGEPAVTQRTERTDQGDQFVMPGATRLQDSGRRLRGKGQQKAADEGLFAPVEPQQNELFSFGPRVTDAFTTAAPEIERNLRARLDRMGISDRVGLRVSDTIRSLVTGREFPTAQGMYTGVPGFPRLIQVAVSASDPSAILHHEAVHAMREMGLFSDREWSALERAARADRDRSARIERAYAAQMEGMSDAERAAAMTEEVIADMYADWSQGRMQARGAIEAMFQRIRNFLRALRNALAGVGFRTERDVFQAMDGGEIGGRQGASTPRPTERMGGDERLSIAPQDDEGAAAPAAPGAPQRQSMMIRALNSQPIDRAIRIPFDWFGGRDAQGRWKPGLYVSDRAGKIITTAKVPENFPLSSAVNLLLHKARIGLVDRYGLDPDYVERDRQRGLEERRTLMKVPDIIDSIGRDLQPDEYAALHAVLTGETVGDNRWSKIAEPIRNAIDQMGQEAVDLGLLSAEAYERNKGKYLHRVYAKHELDDGKGLTGWVNRMSNRARKRIVGDQFKGRGIFVEVPPAKLLSNTDEMATLRKRNAVLRMLDKRRDDLIRRREVAEARVEEGSQEMASTLERRAGTAEASKALQRKGGATVVLKPSSYQKGQAREQGVALIRLQHRGNQARALLDKIDGQLSEVNSKIVDIETRIFAAEEIAPKVGTKFTMLDKMGEDKGTGEPKVAARAYVPEGAAPDKRYADYEDKGVWEVRGTKGGKAILWRDFTKPERERMGEIVDARYGIAKTFMQAAHDLATGRFFKDIAGNREWSREQEPPEGTWMEASEFNRYFGAPEDIGWVRVPDTKIPKTGTKRYGALSGMYVRAEIWRDMAETEAMNSPTFWDAFLRQWKLNKTARSPVAHMNNVMSNMIFMDMADIRAGDLAQAVRSMVTQDATYREAVENGAFGSDMVTQDLRRDILQPILDGMRDDARNGKGGIEGALEAAGPEFAKKGAILARMADKTLAGAKWLDDKMLRAYQVEDEVFRMAAYIRSRGKGLDAQTAALEARDTFLNYDIKAPWINAARRTFLPFIAYTYRAAPMVAKTIAARPWKLAKYAAIGYALNAAAYALAPGDEEDKDKDGNIIRDKGEGRERRSLRREEQGTTWIGTDRLMRMPFYDRNGNPVFLDTRRWIPVGDIFEVGRGVGAVDLPSVITPSGPLMLGAELLLNRSAFTGQDIVNPLIDTPGEKFGKSADYLWKAWMPGAPWVPGSWYWSRIGDAAGGAMDYQGRTYSVPQALASSVGIKLKSQDVAEAQAFQQFEYEKVERALHLEARRIARRRDRNLITEDEFNAEMAALVEKMEKLGVDRQRVLGGGGDQPR